MTDTFSNANLGKYAMQVLNALREENLSYLRRRVNEDKPLMKRQDLLLRR